eukprot:5014954-Amphidinium_carterae.1
MFLSIPSHLSHAPTLSICVLNWLRSSCFKCWQSASTEPMRVPAQASVNAYVDLLLGSHK